MPESAEIPHAGTGRHLFLYDGICGLCNRVNQFVLRHDAGGQFDFASLQSPTGHALLQRLGHSHAELTTFYVVGDYRSTAPIVLSKARAALFVARALGWPWRLVGAFAILPTPLLDFFYDLVARFRYRLFGRFETCPLPTPQQRHRFIDV